MGAQMRLFEIVFFTLLCCVAQADPIPMATFNFVAQNVTFQWAPDTNGLPRYGEFRYNITTYWSPLAAYNCVRVDTWSPDIGTVLPANKPVSLYQIVTWKFYHPDSTVVVNCQ